MTLSLEPIFRAAHLKLKPRTRVPQMHVHFFPFAGLTHTARYRDEQLWIRVSDLFVDAPEQVVHALAVILLGKIYRRKVDSAHHDTYRSFILKSSMQERARHARSTRGRGPRPAVPKGRWQDLETNFERLNSIYFGGKLERPRLTWSTKRSRRILGRYDATHHMVVISLLFDSPRTPDVVLDFVLYHELLHVKHPSRAGNCRMVTHTPEFRAEEVRFEGYKQATEWLRRI
jgi:predicted metal-dependent hydrolase